MAKIIGYVSFHPVFLDEKRLINLNDIYQNTNAKNITFHPNDFSQKTMKILETCHISIENLEDEDLLFPIMERNKNLNFTLDISHSYILSKTRTSELLNVFSERVKQVHLSVTANGVCHQPFKKGEENFFNSIKPLKKFNLPAFIETNCGDNLSLLQNEIEAWRAYFNE